MTRSKLIYLPLVALALAGSVSGWSQAPERPPTPAEQSDAAEDVGIGVDRRSRMTVPIMIDGKGPYDFLIDTGAERTVISAELAKQLALPEGRRARMHSMSGVADVSTAIIPKLQLSRNTVSKIHAPALKQAHIGAAGMLGIDTLQRQRVIFDFEREKMTVMPSRQAEQNADGNEIVVRARSRFGRLVLVDAMLDGQKLMVVLDTGSEVTIGNQALRAKLEKKKRIEKPVPIELVSVVGEEIPADYTQVKRIKIGGLNISNLPVAFAEVHPFKQLQLTDRPALLLGMDALRLFDRVSVDFANRKVRFIFPDSSSLSGTTRMAARSGVAANGS